MQTISSSHESPTPVQQFYNGQTIFVTGGSGFMGKVLVEKLLYACPGVQEVFLLMRPKRGKSVEARLDEMFNKLPLFQRIRDECPHVLKKVTPVLGDITSDSLGLSAAHRQMLCDRVTIVYHLAATLKLEASLCDAIEMNLNGTQRVLDLCNELPLLQQMLHLSTAFCNCDQPEMAEQVYDYPHQPADLMQCTAWMDGRLLERITPELLRPHVNAYTYSKRLAEILVRQQYPRLPVAIVRPSIVTPSWSEPVPGWVDSLNGPTGIMAGAAKGVIRTMLINGENPSEIIPVDMAINGLITIPYDIRRRSVAADGAPAPEMPVFNVTCCESQKTIWKRVLELGENINKEYPIEAGVWYPGGSMTTSVVLHTTRLVLFHWLPAYLIDFLLMCFGQKRFMLRVQQKVSTGLEVLSFFTLRKWVFRSEKYSAIFEDLTDRDKVLFNMDMEPVDVAEYMKRCILGGRQYCLKEPLSTLPKARMQMKAMYVLDRVTKIFFVWLFLSYLFSWTGLMSVFSS